MSRTIATGLAALAMLATAGPSAAQAADAAGPDAADGAIVCQVSGYDVVLVNTGTAPVAAGTGVTWSVRFARMDGTHVLEDDLVPGGVHVLTGALGSSYLGTRTPCEVLPPP